MIFNYVLMFVLLALIIFVIYAISQMRQRETDFEDLMRHPEKLQHILNSMINHTQRSNNWYKLEFMREEIKKALITVDLSLYDQDKTPFHNIKKQETDFDDLMRNPENLQYILNIMIKYTQKSNDWNKLELMREEIRKSLRTIDLARHDPNNTALRASKAEHRSH